MDIPTIGQYDIPIHTFGNYAQPISKEPCLGQANFLDDLLMEPRVPRILTTERASDTYMCNYILYMYVYTHLHNISMYLYIYICNFICIHVICNFMLK